MSTFKNLPPNYYEFFIIPSILCLNLCSFNFRNQNFRNQKFGFAPVLLSPFALLLFPPSTLVSLNLCPRSLPSLPKVNAALSPLLYITWFCLCSLTNHKTGRPFRWCNLSILVFSFVIFVNKIFLNFFNYIGRNSFKIENPQVFEIFSTQVFRRL